MNFSKHYNKRVLMLVGAFLTLAIAGCGAKQYRRVEPSGFLGDYSKMQDGEGNEALSVYVNPKTNCHKYRKVIIDRVVLRGKPEDSALALLDLKDQKMLATLGWGTLYDAMHKGKFEIVTKPGPDVMRIKGAVTEAAKANVIVADIMVVAPYVWEAATLWGLGTGKWPFLGELAGEMEIADSLTGERLFVAMDKVVGTLGSNMDPRARWDDVRQGFDMWREKLGVRMGSCHETGSFKMPADQRNWVTKTYEYVSP
ncbi:MAG: DUF3313 domain-containing protein [Methylococcaceae bacterium]|nr:DUF3313 domain-containing protein [Methylococcaceae bacterium]